MDKPVLPTATAADQLIDRDKSTPDVLDARKWGAPVVGTPATVTYSFLGTAALVDTNGDGAELRLTRSEIARVEDYLTLISDIANVTFERVAGVFSDAGEIQIQKRSTTFGNATTTFFVGVGEPDEIIKSVVTLGRVVDGGTGPDWFSQRHAIHEVLHALGLDHPSDYNGGAAVVTYENDASFFQDSTQYTVMSYFFGRETGASYSRPPDATMMLLDVIALQKLYGASTDAFSGDTVYGFGSNTDRVPWTLTDASDTIFGAIWDSGGTDTVDLSGYALPSMLDLRPLQFSSMNGETDTMSIAPGAQIENAIGGAGDDTLGGNGLANLLIGNEGADRLTGRDGEDTLWGGTGADVLLGGGKRDVLKGGANDDKLSGGALHDVLFGQRGNDTVGGGGGDDTLFGGDGRDRITASSGDDVIQGGRGPDTLFGGSGADTFRWVEVADSGPVEPDRIAGTGANEAFVHGQDLIDLSEIDANISRSGDQAFVFGGNRKGQLAVSKDGEDTLIRVHIYRDGIADMVIEVADRGAPLSAWSAADFLL